jgi:hypothetical protein
MNYYEELGIRSDADEEEIRKAHRRLVKLMHPDQHRDQSLKQLAETQMRRLNSIVATLLDPEERREYDDQLRGADAVNAAPHQSTWRSVPWWIASTLGAIVLTVGAVYFFADHIGSSFQTRSTPPPALESPAPEKSPDVTAVRVPPAPDSPVKPATAPPESPPQAQSTPSQGLLGQNSPETTVANEPVPKQENPKPPVVMKTATPAFPPTPVPEKQATLVKETGSSKPTVPSTRPVVEKRTEIAKTLPRAAPPATTSISVYKEAPPWHAPEVRKLKEVPEATAQPTRTQTLDASLRPPSPALGAPNGTGIDIPPPTTGIFPPPLIHNHNNRDPLEGEWVYAPIEPEKHRPGLYPPEFIQLRLTKDTDGMRGEYSARYSIADNRPVSPNVNFVMKATDPKALHYIWTAADGSKGWFVIRSLETDTMRLEWKATSHNGTALTSGMATLVRKN